MNIYKQLCRTLCFSLIFTLIAGFSASIYAAKESKYQIKRTPFTLPIKDIQRFSMVIAQIKQYYIEPVDDKTLFNSAIRGMLSSLDPHSDYLDPDSLKEIESATSGKFGGIGIEVMPENGLIKIISPLDDTPATRAGIEAGDTIVRVDGKMVKDMTLREAVNLMRGKKGTDVYLTIIRKNIKKPLNLKITRDIIRIQTIKSRMLEPGYGYFRVSFFQAPAKRDLIKAVAKLKKQAGGKLNGAIIDLRNNPGGLLDAAIDISDAFLDAKNLKDNKLIVFTKGRVPGADIKAKATAGDILENTPIVVLINEGSASASEIVAGALQDHKRAVVMGAKSFGKGSVQTVIPIDYQSGIKLTTALYYTPNGRSIQAKGIDPDILVANLKIPKTKTDAIVFDPLEEADLDGHLANGNESTKEAKSKKDKATKAAAKKEEEKLIHEDYQLYTALMLLKGLHIAQQR